MLKLKIVTLPHRALMPLFLTCLAVCLPSMARPDEVDDILAKKIHNRDKVKRFHAEVTVDTDQPPIVKGPKTTRMRFKFDLTRLPPGETKRSKHPWLVEAETLEPHQMKLRVKGDQAWFLDHRGNWTELRMPDTVRETFEKMPETFLGADAALQRQKFAIKVLRHNNPIFGPKTRTVEFVPKEKTKTFARMEEDLNDDGLALETRIFDASGGQSTRIKVKKHHKASGIPVVDEMESRSQSPAGEIAARTSCRSVQVECEP